MTPFSYPGEPHVRRHGPTGYATYQQYRPWLRDEFVFRCVYCLKREQWDTIRGAYHIEHFEPQVTNPEKARKYDNLLYACCSCNATKAKQIVPDPCECMLADDVELFDDGRIRGRTPEARGIIDKLRLDAPDYVEYRKMWIGIVQQLQNAPDILHVILKYPDDLPNLERLKPPGGNSRPEGVNESCHARRKRGELPATY